MKPILSHLFVKSFRLAILSVAVLFFVTFTNAAEAMYEMDSSSVSNALNKMSGDWYDYDGKLVMTIQDGYINGCKVISGFNFAGGSSMFEGIFRIVETQGYRDMFISVNVSGPDENLHQYLVINHKMSLRRSPTAKFFESIGGVYLGMSKKELLSRYGQPTMILTRQQTSALCGVMSESWYYKSDGWLVTFLDEKANGIDRIIMFKDGTRHFDRTGFNCKDSLVSYAREYGVNRVLTKGSMADIGYGEFISFDNYPNSIMLTLYNN